QIDRRRAALRPRRLCVRDRPRLAHRSGTCRLRGHRALRRPHHRGRRHVRRHHRPREMSAHAPELPIRGILPTTISTMKQRRSTTVAAGTRFRTKEAATFAEALANEAGEIALRYFRRPLAVDTKADSSPVTEADRQIEAVICQRIHARYPTHGLL